MEQIPSLKATPFFFLIQYIKKVLWPELSSWSAAIAQHTLCYNLEEIFTILETKEKEQAAL